MSPAFRLDHIDLTGRDRDALQKTAAHDFAGAGRAFADLVIPRKCPGRRLLILPRAPSLRQGAAQVGPMADRAVYRQIRHRLLRLVFRQFSAGCRFGVARPSDGAGNAGQRLFPRPAFPHRLGQCLGAPRFVFCQTAPPSGLFAVNPDVFIGRIPGRAQVAHQTFQPRAVQRGTVIAMSRFIDKHVEVKAKSRLHLLPVFCPVFRGDKLNAGSGPGSHLERGALIRFHTVEVITVFAPVHEDHRRRRGVEHAVEKRRQQTVARRGEDGLRFVGLARAPYDAVEKQREHDSVRHFGGQTAGELRAALAGEGGRLRKRASRRRIKPPLVFAVRLEVERQTFGAAFADQPGTDTDLFSQGAPAGVVRPINPLRGRVESQEIVGVICKSSRPQIRHRRVEPFLFPGHRIPTALGADGSAVVRLRGDLEDDTVERTFAFHLVGKLSQKRGVGNVPSEFDEFFVGGGRGEGNQEAESDQPGDGGGLNGRDVRLNAGGSRV